MRVVGMAATHSFTAVLMPINERIMAPR